MLSIETGVGAYRDALLRRGLLVATGVPGVYGRSGEFEDTLERIDRAIVSIAVADHAEVLRFPSVVSRAAFERSGYLESFPQLVGAIRCFHGDERAHRSLLRSVEDGDDWSAAFASTDLVLAPAACYPVYPVLAGTLPAGGRTIDVRAACFRREVSDDPARMQVFRMHEWVRAGSERDTASWRDTWLRRAEALVVRLEFDAITQPASDPFFGRGGKLLAAGQREQRLKLEIAVPISDAAPTAIVSLNDHQERFARLFDINSEGGAPAHTSCIGFGLERMTLALYRRHGFERARWPARVREALGL